MRVVRHIYRKWRKCVLHSYLEQREKGQYQKDNYRKFLFEIKIIWFHNFDATFFFSKERIIQVLPLKRRQFWDKIASIGLLVIGILFNMIW